MIHSNIKASSRSVPERVLFSSVCFPLRRLGRRWGAFSFVTVRITLLISSTRTVYRFPQITTTQNSANLILAVQGICGALKQSGRYFTIHLPRTSCSAPHKNCQLQKSQGHQKWRERHNRCEEYAWNYCFSGALGQGAWDGAIGVAGKAKQQRICCKSQRFDLLSGLRKQSPPCVEQCHKRQ